MTFEKLNLSKNLLTAVTQAGYKQPSPIQEKAIPPVLEQKDLLACAQTGTGKTAAFALPILQLLQQDTVTKKSPIKALILTPTRELALQIYESFEAYGKHMHAKCAVIFGGVGQGPQVQKLKQGVNILVATPGRLNDLIGQGFIKLDKLEIFVLDEADRMLDMGFVHDVKKVIKLLPQKRQTLLFSATMPKEIVQLADTILNNPVKVFVTPPATTVEKIKQTLYYVEKQEKRTLLASLLQKKAVESALVFTRTKHGADRVVRELKRENIVALAIHGNKSQTARQSALNLFKKGEVKVLVATDIAARGLDINELTHVFNYDLPNIPETYVHRIGRTGRAGHSGIAISFCSPEEMEYLADIEKLIGFSIPRANKPTAPAQNVPTSEAKQKPAAQNIAPKETKPTPNGDDKMNKQNDRRYKSRHDMNSPDNRRYNNKNNNQKSQKNYQNEVAAGEEEYQLLKNTQTTSNGEHRNYTSKPQKHTQPKAAVPQEQYKMPKTPPPINKDERGIFNFTESELAADTSIRLLSSDTPSGEAKFANFEEFLKSR